MKNLRLFLFICIFASVLFSEDGPVYHVPIHGTIDMGLPHYIQRVVNEAKENIRARLMELSEKHKYKYNKVFIREQKTRWGSCSVKNNINLNIKLVLLPSRLMDYVILHELVHTKHKNHSPLFWTELDNLTGSAKVLNKQLKSYGIGLL